MMKREEEREREIVSDSFLSLSLSALYQDLSICSLYCYACWGKRTHVLSLILFQA